MTSFSQATLLLNSSEITKLAFNKASVAPSRKMQLCSHNAAYEVCFISGRPRPLLISSSRAVRKKKEKIERNNLLSELRALRVRRIVNSARFENSIVEDTFLHERMFPRRETDAVYLSRYESRNAFANFNEPEWLAAADSTFLRSSRRGNRVALQSFLRLMQFATLRIADVNGLTPISNCEFASKSEMEIW